MQNSDLKDTRDKNMSTHSHPATRPSGDKKGDQSAKLCAEKSHKDNVSTFSAKELKNVPHSLTKLVATIYDNFIQGV